VGATGTLRLVLQVLRINLPVQHTSYGAEQPSATEDFCHWRAGLRPGSQSMSLGENQADWRGLQPGSAVGVIQDILG